MKKYSRPRYRHKRKPNEDSGAIRLLVLSTLILGAVLLKTITGVSAQTVFQEVSSIITGEQTYAQAVSALGDAIVNGAKDNAVFVFGQKLIGIDGNKQKESAPTIIPKSTQTDDPPMVNELKKDVEETAFPGRVVKDPAFPPQAERLDIQQVEWMSNDAEYQDDTLDLPFEMPSPDIVDNKKYTISFPTKRPVKGRVTSPFGYRVHPISQETTFHYGVDLAGESGSKICAFADGIVVARGVGEIYGNYVKIQHSNGYLSFYAHMSKISVKKGQKIKMGSTVGLVGTTGNSTGPHLHFEVRKDGKVTNPSNYIG